MISQGNEDEDGHGPCVDRLFVTLWLESASVGRPSAGMAYRLAWRPWPLETRPRLVGRLPTQAGRFYVVKEAAARCGMPCQPMPWLEALSACESGAMGC